MAFSFARPGLPAGRKAHCTDDGRSRSRLLTGPMKHPGHGISDIAGDTGRWSGAKDAVCAFVKAALDVLLPEEEGCTLCGRVRARGMVEVYCAPICSDCLSRIAFVQPPYCEKCGRPVRGVSADGADVCGRSASAGRVCRDCAAGGRFFALARAAGVYDGALKECIHAMKFSGRRELSEGIGVLMARVAARDESMRRSQLLVPVPLHPKRLAERGYNQAELLARMVESCLAIPVRTALVRSVLTGEQNKLGRRGRQDNLRGVFAVPHPLDVAGKSVLLIDDVMTTGATANECSRALLRAGAREVRVLAAAVTPLESEWLREQ